MKMKFTLNLKALLFATLLLPLISFAQIEVKWKKPFTTNIQWQEVSSLGNLIVCSGEGLMGVNTETGNVIWKKSEHANLSRQTFRELPNSPFFTIDVNNIFYLVDQFSGDEVFNSSKAGIKEIKDYFLLYNSDAILVAGNDAAGAPVMLSVKMSDGSLSWKMNEKFGRIIAANELGNNELLIVTLFNNYKLNAKTGKIIWKEVNSKEVAQLDKLGAFGALMKQAAENMTKDMEIELRYYKKPGDDIFYLASQKENQSGFSTSGGTSVSYTNNYLMEVVYGIPIWK